MILQAYTGGGKLATQKEFSCYWFKPLRRTYGRNASCGTFLTAVLH